MYVLSNIIRHQIAVSWCFCYLFSYESYFWSVLCCLSTTQKSTSSSGPDVNIFIHQYHHPLSNGKKSIDTLQMWAKVRRYRLLTEMLTIQYEVDMVPPKLKPIFYEYFINTKLCSVTHRKRNAVIPKIQIGNVDSIDKGGIWDICLWGENKTNVVSLSSFAWYHVMV